MFLGAVLAYITYPLYAWTSPKVKYKSLGAFLVCLLVILLITIPAFFLVKVLIQQAYVQFIVLKQNLAGGVFQGCHNAFCQKVEQVVNNPAINSALQDISKSATKWIIGQGSTFLVSLPSMALNLLMVFLSMFYFLRDGKDVVNRLGVLFDTQAKKYALVVARLDEVLKGIIYGYLLIALLVGIVGSLGFFLFGISSPLLWGVVMALATFIPVVGSGMVWVPASLFLFLDGMFQDSTSIMLKGMGLFLYGLLVIGGVDNFLRPKIVGDRAKIHPLVMLLGIVGGVLLVGAFGILIGPVVLSLTLFIFDLYMPEKK